MPRITYTAAQKEHALRRCAEIGVSKASEETGIAVNSLYTWRRGAKKGDVLPVAGNAAKTVEYGIESKKKPRQSRKAEITQTEPSDELIQLRVEKELLKEQVATLKKALLAFTELTPMEAPEINLLESD